MIKEIARDIHKIIRSRFTKAVDQKAHETKLLDSFNYVLQNEDELTNLEQLYIQGVKAKISKEVTTCKKKQKKRQR